MAEHVCPPWVGYLLASGLRKLFQNPQKIVGPYVRPGMTVLDVGSAMGFFSLPMAKMVGAGGRVVCVDVQPKMLEVLGRRAEKAGLGDRIETHVPTGKAIGLPGRREDVDFALAFAVLHEVPNQATLLEEIHATLKPGAALLLAEPTHHVEEVQFDRTISKAQAAGFALTGRPSVHMSRAAILTKPEGRAP